MFISRFPYSTITTTKTIKSWCIGLSGSGLLPGSGGLREKATYGVGWAYLAFGFKSIPYEPPNFSKDLGSRLFR